MSVLQNLFQTGKEPKLANITFAIMLFFSSKYLEELAILIYLGVYFCDKPTRHASKRFILVQRTPNVQFVNRKYVTYTQPIYVPLNILATQHIYPNDIKKSTNILVVQLLYLGSCLLSVTQSTVTSLRSATFESKYPFAQM